MRPEITGDDLLAAGVPEGPEIGAARSRRRARRRALRTSARSDATPSSPVALRPHPGVGRQDSGSAI